jgi:tetraacyldisaccharide 4'-kinase
VRALLPLSWIFGFIVWLRNRAFDAGRLKSTRVTVPVISVGNISVGGTGKTPLVDYIAEVLLSRSKRVAVASRGYGRESSGVVVVSDGSALLADERTGGDEPVQLAQKHPGLIVVVGERRVDAAQKAIALGAEIIVLDDGFQHRALARDLDIVVMRESISREESSLIPAGVNREPLSSLARADLVAFSRVANDRQMEGAREIIGPYFRGPCAGYRTTITRLVHAGGAGSLAPDDVQGRSAIAFSGIGNPERFASDLRALGLVVKDHIRFRDHHRFTPDEFRQIWRRSEAMEAGIIVTTEKDMVRLSGEQDIVAMVANGVPLYHTATSIEITAGREELHQHLEKYLRGASQEQSETKGIPS